MNEFIVTSIRPFLRSTNKILSDDSDEPGIPMHFISSLVANGNSPTLFNEQPSILLCKSKLIVIANQAREEKTKDFVRLIHF